MKKKLLFLLLFSSSFLFGSDSKKDHPYWPVFLQLGYDCQQKKVDPRLAYRNIEDMIRFGREILYHFQLTPPTQTFIDTLRAKLGSLDIGNLYTMLPYRSNQSWRGLAMEGGRRRHKFSISLTDPALKSWLKSSGEKKFSEWTPLQKLGDFSLRIFARPQKGNTYLFHTEAQTHLGSIQCLALVHGFTKLLQVTLASSNRRKPPPPSFQKTYSHLTPQGLKILYAFSLDFSHVLKQINHFLEIRRILDDNQPESGQYIHINLVLRPRIQAFSKAFGEIQKIFRSLKGVFRIRVRLYDGSNNLIAIVETDTRNFTFNIQFLTSGGRLLTSKADWEPINLQGIDFTSPKKLSFKTVLDAKINIKGIHISIRNFRMHFQYLLEANGPKITIHFTRPPQVFKIKGYLFGVIPLWLVDFFIPSNLDTIIHQFLNTLARGNGGKGMQSIVRLVHLPDGRNRLQLITRAEVLSNGLIRFAFSFQSQAGLANPKLYREIRRFGRIFWHAFVADYFQYRYGK